jgi:hypothetical protein
MKIGKGMQLGDMVEASPKTFLRDEALVALRRFSTPGRLLFGWIESLVKLILNLVMPQRIPPGPK